MIRNEEPRRETYSDHSVLNIARLFYPTQQSGLMSNKKKEIKPEKPLFRGTSPKPFKHTIKPTKR